MIHRLSQTNEMSIPAVRRAFLWCFMLLDQVYPFMTLCRMLSKWPMYIPK